MRGGPSRQCLNTKGAGGKRGETRERGKRIYEEIALIAQCRTTKNASPIGTYAQEPPAKTECSNARGHARIASFCPSSVRAVRLVTNHTPMARRYASIAPEVFFISRYCGVEQKRILSH